MSNYTIIGRVGRDPDLRFSENGIAVCKFSVAVSKGKKVNGQWEDTTVWHDLVCFKEVAENAAASLNKGDEIIAEGYLEEPRSYEKKDGTTGISIPFVANALGVSLRWATTQSLAASANGKSKMAPPVPTYSEEPF